MQESIKSESGMLGALRKLSGSGNPRVKKAAKGALWKLEGEQRHQLKQSKVFSEYFQGQYKYSTSFNF